MMDPSGGDEGEDLMSGSAPRDDLSAHFGGNGVDSLFPPLSSSQGSARRSQYDEPPPPPPTTTTYGPFDPVVHHESSSYHYHQHQQYGGEQQGPLSHAYGQTTGNAPPPNPSQVLFHQTSFSRAIYQDQEVLWDSDNLRPKSFSPPPVAGPTPPTDKRPASSFAGTYPYHHVGDAAYAGFNIPTDEGPSVCLTEEEEEEVVEEEPNNTYEYTEVDNNLPGPFDSSPTPVADEGLSFISRSPPPDTSGPASQPREAFEGLDLNGGGAGESDVFTRHIVSPFDNPSERSHSTSLPSISSPPMHSSSPPNSLGVEPSPSLHDMSVSSRASGYGSNISSPAQSGIRAYAHGEAGPSPTASFSSQPDVGGYKNQLREELESSEPNYFSSPPPPQQINPAIPDTLFGGSSSSAFEGMSDRQPQLDAEPLHDSSELFGGPIHHDIIDHGRPPSAQILSSPPGNLWATAGGGQYRTEHIDIFEVYGFRLND